MKRPLVGIVAGFMMLGTSAVQASDPQDVGTCQVLFDQGKAGLFYLHAGQFVQVNGTGIDYDPGGRFYYVWPGAGGRPFHVTRETVWHVRTQTIAKSGKADEALLWRPGVRTQCSPDRPLETFNDYNRFVTLQRYYDHHSAADETQRPDPAIASSFHFTIDNPDERTRCSTRTDDPKTVGDLRKTYGFVEVDPDEPAIARVVEPSRAVAATRRTESHIFSGLSSELALAAPGEPACFGFNAPLPTRSSAFTDFFPIFRNVEALSMAQTWQPISTMIAIQRIPRGARSGTVIVHWNH